MFHVLQLQKKGNDSSLQMIKHYHMVTQIFINLQKFKC